MSNPPHGPPPPYGYPPPPPHSGIAFVPAPVMMPVYPPPPVRPETSNPTYVTNYYYPNQPPAEQMPVVQPVELPIDWVTATTATAATYSHKALEAGREGWDGSPLWVIRAHHNGELLPGKLAIKHRAAYVPHGGKEVPVHSFDILLAKPDSIRWVPSSNGQVPVGAYPAGNTHTGEPLYIARVRYQNSITPGKVHPSHQCCYISFGGAEISFRQYEVLCENSLPSSFLR